MSSILEEARKRSGGGGQPTGPEDTASVDGDIDMSDYTDKPAEARAERVANPPPPPPPKPGVPAALTAPLGNAPPPKPPAKKIGKAAIKGPQPKGGQGGPGAKGAPSPGEIVKKPAPPLPAVWKKPKPGVPVGELPPPPAKGEKVKPKQDPAFTKVIKAAGMTVKQTKKHPSAKDESKAAQGAAVPPGNDIDAQAKANRADTMATAKPKPFDEDAFVHAVKEAMAKTAPKSLNEAGDVGEKASGAKEIIGDKVGTSKEKAAGDVEAKSKQAPDPSTATPKPVTPMAPLEIEKPGGLQASGAMPAPVPNEQIDMRAGPAKVDNEMGEAGVTEEQLAKSNEPEFTGALEAKKETEDHSAQAPADIRKVEGQILKQATAASAADEKKTVGDAQSTITDTVGKVGGQKNETKSKDELKRKEVADHINALYDKTKTDVEGILGGLDEKVDTEFTAGEAQVRASFTADWNRRLDAYKDDRYSGWRGPFRWARDKWKGLPAAANKLFDVSRQIYEQQMEALVRRIAKIVSQELTRATVRIEQGRGEVAAYVSGLKGDLAKFGEEAAADINDKFEGLNSSVQDKFDDLAGSLAKKYSESREKVDAEIEAAKEANQGLLDKAIGAVKAVIRVIGQLKDMIVGILSKIAGVIGRIIADPIGFLKRLVNAIRDGISGFVERIGEHLQKGLMGWLFGALDAKGIDMPDSFSIEGIMKLVLSVLGMSWNFIRERLVKKIGEPAMNALESGADLIKKVIDGGPGVLWEMLVEKFTDFQDMVIGEIKSFVTEKVIKAGVSWLLGLLTPAGAFVKACQAIYSIVMFFVERGSQIKELIETIVDSAKDIAEGGGGGIPAKIEGVLAKLLPLAISFLANLLGLGGVGDKVRSIIDKVRNPIHKAMDKVIDVVLNVTAPVWKPIKKLYGKGKELYGKAKDKAIKAYEAGKAKVKAVGNRVKDVAKAGVAKVKAKVKDAGAWVADKGRSAVAGGKALAGKAKDKVVGLFKRQEEGFAMSGASHHLIGEPEADGLNIYMQSRRQRLTAKIAEVLPKLRDRAEKEDEPKKGATLRLVAALTAIAGRARALEDKARGQKKGMVGPTGAPPGFETEMRSIADGIAHAGDDAKIKDILAAPAGTEVDMAMLSKFGMPVASYLQAQDTADKVGATIDIRPTNVQAPELLAKGHLPKSKDFKEKTINELDTELGIPKRFIGKMAWFNPPALPAQAPAGIDAGRWAKITDRFKQRRDEYQSGLKDMPARLANGEFSLIEVNDDVGGVVLADALKKIAYTGDHDLFDVRPGGVEQTVIDHLEPSPFRVQHGAHLMWPMLPEVLAKGGMSPKERMIYEDIIRKHGPGGEALLRVRPHEVPVTGNAHPLPPLPDHEKGKEKAEIFTVEPTGWQAGEVDAGRYLTEAGTLINGAQAYVDPNKVFAYALNTDHPVGKNKARVFQSMTGFNRDNGQALVAALIVGARTAPAQPGKVDQHGSRFTLMIPVAGPTGSATMTTGWIYGPGKKIPSLTTLYIET